MENSKRKYHATTGSAGSSRLNIKRAKAEFFTGNVDKQEACMKRISPKCPVGRNVKYTLSQDRSNGEASILLCALRPERTSMVDTAKVLRGSELGATMMVKLTVKKSLSDSGHVLRGADSSRFQMQDAQHASSRVTVGVEHPDLLKLNPRNDPRYNQKADKDGYYYCPFRVEGCNHKLTKQKCIYAKNLDSHLKPYTCRYDPTNVTCRSLRFSSNACLFRHERDVHGLHNYGINEYLCKFEGCERARHDHGFPRQWNQLDHMKRVHGYEEVDSNESVDRGYTDSSAQYRHRQPVPGFGSVDKIRGRRTPLRRNIIYTSSKIPRQATS